MRSCGALSKCRNRSWIDARKRPRRSVKSAPLSTSESCYFQSRGITHVWNDGVLAEKHYFAASVAIFPRAVIHAVDHAAAPFIQFHNFGAIIIRDDPRNRNLFLNNFRNGRMIAMRIMVVV